MNAIYDFHPFIFLSKQSINELKKERNIDIWNGTADTLVQKFICLVYPYKQQLNDTHCICVNTVSALRIRL